MSRIIGDLEGLIAAIEHRGRAEAQSKQKQSEQQATEILDEARGQADQLRREILDRARREAGAKQRRRRAEATRAAQRDYLQSREELLEQVWQQAEERLRALPEQEETDEESYVEILERLAGLAARTLGGGRLSLAAEAAGQALLTEDRLEQWSREAGEALEAEVVFERAAEPIETWGGLLVKQKESRRQVDLTFPTRLRLATEEIREKIFERLEGPHAES